MKRLIACAFCWTEFVPKVFWQVFCKRDCSDAFHGFYRSKR